MKPIYLNPKTDRVILDGSTAIIATPKQGGGTRYLYVAIDNCQDPRTCSREATNAISKAVRSAVANPEVMRRQKLDRVAFAMSVFGRTMQRCRQTVETRVARANLAAAAAVKLEAERAAQIQEILEAREDDVPAIYGYMQADMGVRSAGCRRAFNPSTLLD